MSEFMQEKQTLEGIDFSGILMFDNVTSFSFSKITSDIKKKTDISQSGCLISHIKTLNLSHRFLSSHQIN